MLPLYLNIFLPDCEQTIALVEWIGLISDVECFISCETASYVILFNLISFECHEIELFC